jgi:hypothetical protein
MDKGIVPLLLAASFAAVAGACGSLPAGRNCAVRSDCPPDAHCRAGVCVADRPPVAVITAPASPRSNLLLSFGAHASHDPDPGDAVSAYAWGVRPAGPVDAACEPMMGSARDLAEVTVLFPCGGEFEVSLVVKDSLGLESAPAVRRILVDASTDPPHVVVGADGMRDHHCTGTPLRCTMWDGAGDAFLLSAQASGPLGVTFRYHWSATPPPELAGQPAPRVIFFPGPDAEAPAVQVETDGTAIAGDWRFDVVATDSRGMADAAHQRVRIANRPPVVTGGGTVVVHHAYDPALRRFTAWGTTPPAAWSDPDGDPVTPLGVAFGHSGDGPGATFGGVDLGDRAQFTIAVPHGATGSPAFLTGPGATRVVDFPVADANGARASARWAVEVDNRLPRLESAVPALAVPHAYDAAGVRYVAQAALSTWVDDDGDPLVPSVSGDARCAEVSAEGRVVGAASRARAVVGCALPYPGVPAVEALAGGHDLMVTMSDPWGAGPAQASHVEIGNRAPRLLATSVMLVASCTPIGACCDDGLALGCRAHEVVMAPSSGEARLVVDDDGDPLALGLPGGSCLSATAPAQPCPAEGCAVALALCGGPLQCGAFAPSGVLGLTASDGLGRLEGSVAVDAACR